MPTFVPAARCAQLTINGQQAGVSCQFGLGVQFPTEPVLTDLDALLTFVGSWITSDLIPLMNVQASVTSMKAQVLTTSEGIVKEIELSEEGTEVSDALPSQVSVCMSKQTGLAGRSRRGRLYVWGVAAGFTDSVRTLSIAGIGAYDLAFDNLLIGLLDVDWTPVVISTVSAGAPRVSALVTPVFQVICRDARLDTQRRRLGRAI